MSFRRTWLLEAVLFYLLVGVQSACLSAPFEPTPEYVEAVILQEQGDYQEALAAFEAIVRANPGEQIAGFAQIETYVIRSQHLGQAPDGIRILEEVESEFGFTPAGLSAKMTLNDERNYFEFGSWLEETNGLVRYCGCPTLQEILSGGARLQAKPGISEEEQEWAASQLYHALISRLALEDGRASDELQVNLFLRGAVRSEGVDRYTRQLIKQYALEADRSKLPFTNPPSPNDVDEPRFELETPKVESLQTRDLLEMSITDGDFLQSQVDTSSLSFSVDGADVTETCRFYPEVELSEVLEEGGSFEKIRVLYSVESGLTAGTHRARLSASDHAGNSGYLEFEFSVVEDDSDPGKVTSIEAAFSRSIAALATEQLMVEIARSNPLLGVSARTAYSTWLASD